VSVDYVGIATVLAASTSLVTAAAGAWARIKFGDQSSRHDDHDTDAEIADLQHRLDELAKRKHTRPHHEPPTGHAERALRPPSRAVTA
jgi:hypothetical protein